MLAEFKIQAANLRMERMERSIEKMKNKAFLMQRINEENKRKLDMINNFMEGSEDKIII